MIRKTCIGCASSDWIWRFTGKIKSGEDVYRICQSCVEVLEEADRNREKLLTPETRRID